MASSIIFEEENEETRELRRMGVETNIIGACILEAIAQNEENPEDITPTKTALQEGKSLIDEMLCSVEVLKKALQLSKEKLQIMEEKTIAPGKENTSTRDEIMDIYSDFSRYQSRGLIFAANIYKNLKQINMADYINYKEQKEGSREEEEVKVQITEEAKNNEHFIKLEEASLDLIEGKLSEEKYIKIIEEEEIYLDKAIEDTISPMIEKGLTLEELSYDIDKVFGGYSRGLQYLKLFSDRKDSLLREKGLENILGSLEEIYEADKDAVWTEDLEIESSDAIMPDGYDINLEDFEGVDVVGYMEIKKPPYSPAYGSFDPKKFATQKGQPAAQPGPVNPPTAETPQAKNLGDKFQGKQPTAQAPKQPAPGTVDRNAQTQIIRKPSTEQTQIIKKPPAENTAVIRRPPEDTQIIKKPSAEQTQVIKKPPPRGVDRNAQTQIIKRQQPGRVTRALNFFGKILRGPATLMRKVRSLGGPVVTGAGLLTVKGFALAAGAVVAGGAIGVGIGTALDHAPRLVGGKPVSTYIANGAYRIIHGTPK